ncbi:unnamed protein product [Heligmosomoides polygyrus]|uniref:Transmembrane protein n=1 Tax=Heligmosomoides polygyrus TaxID=6339 RepID=A0A183GVC4_HELPZ|nr:unnamed protein product [Heligmosomoides polygyrus]
MDIGFSVAPPADKVVEDDFSVVETADQAEDEAVENRFRLCIWLGMLVSADVVGCAPEISLSSLVVAVVV